MEMTASLARDLFDYDPTSGALVWKARPREHFEDESYWRRWNDRYPGRAVANVATNGYLRTNCCGKGYLVHRLIWLHVYGEWPEHQIDHINGDRSDNRLSNLRVATKTQNARNARLPNSNTSGVVGVSFDSREGRWHAYIGIGASQRASLGYFATKEEAAAARQGAQRVLGYHPNHGRAA